MSSSSKPPHLIHVKWDEEVPFASLYGKDQYGQDNFVVYVSENPLDAVRKWGGEFCPHPSFGGKQTRSGKYAPPDTLSAETSQPLEPEDKWRDKWFAAARGGRVNHLRIIFNKVGPSIYNARDEQKRTAFEIVATLCYDLGKKRFTPDPTIQSQIKDADAALEFLKQNKPKP